MVLQEVVVPVLPLERLAPVIGTERLRRLEATAEHTRRLMGSRTVWNVNSTATGGGVAEMLQVLVGYARGGGVNVRWVVIAGDAEFFAITKRIHNRVHGWPGDGGPLGRAEAAHYLGVTAANAGALLQQVAPGDVVLLHDPQTAGMAASLASAGAIVVWRSHIGADRGNRHTEEAWRFLAPHVAGAHAEIYSRAAYVPPSTTPGRVVVIPPSIDPFSPKNQDVDRDTVLGVLGHIGVVSTHRAGPAELQYTRQDGSAGSVSRTATIVASEAPSPDVPLVVQVSRWDRLKDMEGVLRGFATAADRSDAALALVGPAMAEVADDPEAVDVLRECTRAWEQLADSVRRRIQLVTLPMDDVDENAAMVNAIQRHARVVVQKSLAEGFGLTVAEAMWKGRPVVASRIGGIVDQVAPGTGVLLDDPADLEGFGAALASLLADPARMTEMGEAARRHIHEHFVGDVHLSRYGELLAGLVG